LCQWLVVGRRRSGIVSGVKVAARTLQLWLGLTLYGLSMDLMVRARLGLDSWDVLHQGLAEHTGLSMGVVVNIVGAVVLLGWIPLRERPGFGTICNVALVGTVFDAALPHIGSPGALWARGLMVLGGIALCGLATGLYISVGWGAGPRDGLMVGLARRMNWSVRLTRTIIELSVLFTGWILGGSVGVGTVLFALLIGPASQLSLRAFGYSSSSSARASQVASRSTGSSNSGFRSTKVWSRSASQASVTSSSPRR
jgi:uncharacterized membrane protein YczE